MHVLDNPIWHALTGSQATVAQGSARARRYDPEVSVFAALPDDVTADDWNALRELLGPGGFGLLYRADATNAPDGWSKPFEMKTQQMVATDPGAFAMAPADRELVFELLGPADIDEVMALIERTKPGPFRPRTIELGTYLGIRSGGKLVAMAGERMHVPGYTEISAVCTDDAFRGQGLAAALSRAIAREIYARDETPILHVLEENANAIRVYEKLGFERRLSSAVVGWQAPS